MIINLAPSNLIGFIVVI